MYITKKSLIHFNIDTLHWIIFGRYLAISYHYDWFPLFLLKNKTHKVLRPKIYNCELIASLVKLFGGKNESCSNKVLWPIYLYAVQGIKRLLWKISMRFVLGPSQLFARTNPTIYCSIRLESRLNRQLIFSM